MPAAVVCEGTQSYGYGGSVCRLDPSEVRAAVAATRGRIARLVPHDAAAEVIPGQDLESAHVLSRGMKDFRTVLSVRNDADHHSTKLEMEPLCSHYGRSSGAGSGMASGCC